MPELPVPAAEHLTDLSPSRIGVANKCGLAFEYQYVRRLPAPYEGGAALFGSAIHDGVAEWYGNGPITDENRHQHKDLSLPQCVNERWAHLLPPTIWAAVEGMLDTHNACLAVGEAIKVMRPSIKNPLQTKQFLESPENKAMMAAKAELKDLTDSSEEVRWPADEDPLTAYFKAELIAKRLERQWKPLPRPLLVEMPFRLEFGDYVLRGKVDQVRQDTNLETGELEPATIEDIKTGRQPFTQMEAFWQSFVYWKANSLWEDMPDTELVNFVLARHVDERGRTKVQHGRVNPKKHEKLAMRILNSVARRITMGDFEPHYGYWCKRCDFADLCQSEIGLWEGDGFEVIK